MKILLKPGNDEQKKRNGSFKFFYLRKNGP